MKHIFKSILTIAIAACITSSATAQVTVSGSTGANAIYSTLKAAFDTLNTKTNQTGNNILVSITANTTETATASLLAASGGAWASLKITPVGNVTISGTIAAGAIIDLNGADFVTIDGLNDGINSLTISNLSTASTSLTSTIRFLADATNNIIKNATILGSATVGVTTNGGSIYFGAGAILTGSDNNIIRKCNIGPAGVNLPTKAIYANGSTTTTNVNNSNNIVDSCNIYDYFLPTAAHAGIYINTGNTDWSINNNKFYQTATRTMTTGALHAELTFKQLQEITLLLITMWLDLQPIQAQEFIH